MKAQSIWLHRVLRRLKSNTALTSAAIALMAAQIIAVSPALADAKRYSINIGATSIAEGLQDLERGTGATLVFSPDQVRDLRTPGVNGDLTVEEALKGLLEGTGLSIKSNGKGAYVIVGKQATAPAPARVLKAAAADARPIPSNPVPPQAAALDEVVVTAQKRSENIQDVPIPISAFSGETLENANIDSVLELQKLSPSFNSVQSGQSANIRLTMRGVGTNGNTAIDSSVGTFMDGIYIPRPGSVWGKLYDIEAIEVLRGPQGMLFGRNTDVGAIALRTKSPTDKLEGSIDVTGGSYGRWDAVGVGNVPISDTAAVRIAIVGSTFNGYAKTLINPDPRYGDQRYGDLNTVGGRASLQFDPIDSVSWLIKADYMKITGNGVPQQELLPRTLTPTTIDNLRTRLGGVLPDVTDPFDRISNQINGSDINDRQWGINSNLTWSLDSGFSVKLINAYRDWDNDQEDEDIVFQPVPVLGRNGYLNSASQTHELQFISPKNALLDGKLDFVSGLYFFRETAGFGERLHLAPLFCTIGASAALRPTCQAGPQRDATNLNLSQTAKSFAVYGQASYKVLDDLTLTLGGRWTDDRKTGLFVQANANAGVTALRVPETTSMRFKDDRFTWRANLAYDLSDDVLVFATYSTGYKSGGFNSGGGTVVLGPRRIFGSETVDNYEIGAKTQWFDNRLTANVTFYRMAIKGFQDRGFDGVTFFVRNAGDLRQQGIEFDSALNVTRNLRADFSIAYLDSAFTNFPGAPGLPAFGGTQDLKGKPLNYSPKWQGNLGAQYADDLGNTGLTWTARADLSFMSNAFIGSINDHNPETYDGGYTVLGARLTLNGRDDRWSVSVFGDNLTGENYCLSEFITTLHGGLGLRNPATGGTALRCAVAPPRTFGVRTGLKF